MPKYLAAGTSSSIIIKRMTTSNFVTPYYVWNLDNKDSKVMNNYYADNYSLSPYFQAFTFSNFAGSPTAGCIPLKQGEYTYRVYEMNEPYNLNLSSTNSVVVTTGILVIGNTYSEVNTYTQSTDQEIFTYNDF